MPRVYAAAGCRATIIVCFLLSACATQFPYRANYDKVADEVVVLGDLQVGHGSGVVISADGLILTDEHVAIHATGSGLGTMPVQFHDGHNAIAKVLWISNRADDVALLKIEDAKSLPYAKFGKEALYVGQPVFHIGNPEFFGWTVTWGHISAFHRDLSQVGSASNLIQNDLSISAGSSGGGLFDIDGNLIGLTNAAFPDNQVMSFAVPRDTILRLLAQNGIK